MRFIGWNIRSDWHEYIENVHSVRRISRSKWEVTYGVPIYMGFRSETIIVICDKAHVEVE